MWSVTEHGSRARHQTLFCCFRSAALQAWSLISLLECGWCMRLVVLTGAMRAQLAHKFNVKSALEHCDAYLSRRAAEDEGFLRLGMVRLPRLSRHRDALSAASIPPAILPGRITHGRCALLLISAELGGRCRGAKNSKLSAAALFRHSPLSSFVISIAPGFDAAGNSWECAGLGSHGQHVPPAEVSGALRALHHEALSHYSFKQILPSLSEPRITAAHLQV